MKLTLRNLGRLREATIDLDKDLILLTGPNNTSKTYVAHALYGFGKNYLSSLGPVLLTALRGFVVSSPEAVPLLKVDLVELVDQCLPQMLEQLARNYRRELVNVLAASEEFVARTEVFLEVGEAQIARGKRILRDLVDTDELKLFGADELYAIRKAKGDPVWTFGRILPTLPSAERPASFELKADSIWLMYAAGYIAGVLSRALFRVSEPYILTAERAAIQLFSRELSLNRTELVDSLLQIKSSGERQSQVGAAVLGTLEQRAQRYPLAIRDGLRIANDLAAYRKLSSPFAPLAEQLEGRLLGGAIRIDDDGEMSFHPNDSGARLTLHLASSSVKSLAGLSFFLRHTAKANQFLIIDEPELNLHPDNQRRVARVLARLVRSGIKVLISTHSDYIIRELNNLIMLSADKDGSVRQRLGYDEGETLSPEQVGAYLFDSEQANPITVTSTGIEVATIEREINALNAVSQDIYFTLFGGTGG